MVPKSTTLDDLEQLLPTLLDNKVFCRAQHENLNEDVHTIRDEDVAQ